MLGALKRGFRSMASLILVSNVVGELQPKRTLAASRGFLAAARLSCSFNERYSQLIEVEVRNYKLLRFPQKLCTVQHGIVSFLRYHFQFVGHYLSNYRGQLMMMKGEEIRSTCCLVAAADRRIMTSHRR